MDSVKQGSLWHAGNVLRDDAYINLDGVVTKSSAKTFKNLVFIEVTAMVEAAAVIPFPGGLPLLPSFT